MQCHQEFKAKFNSIEWVSSAVESQTSVNILPIVMVIGILVGINGILKFMIFP